MSRTPALVPVIGALILVTGCELAIPLLIAEATKDTDPRGHVVPLRVDVESLSGVVNGVDLSTVELTEVSGSQIDGFSTFALRSANEPAVELTLEVCEGGALGADPYGGGEPGSRDSLGDGGFLPLPTPDGRPSGGPLGGSCIQPVLLTVCTGLEGPVSRCESIGENVVMQLSDDSQGRHVSADVQTAEGDELSVALRYVAER